MRDNILFGLPYDEQRFNYAIEVASLIDDLLQMPGEHDCKDAGSTRWLAVKQRGPDRNINGGIATSAMPCFAVW